MKRFIFLPILTILLSITSASAQWEEPQFTRISTNEGLSQSHVNTILKDSKGFMWFGTDEGLNRYDGYTFSIYKHSAQVATSITDNTVYDILEDKSGVIWIATQKGLNKFDRTSNTFSHYLQQLTIRDIMQGQDQLLWLGTTSGLYSFDPITGATIVRKCNPADKNSLSDNSVTKVTADNNGNLWISTLNGLNRLTLKTNHVDRYIHNPKDPNSISSNLVRTVFSDSRHTIWIGMTEGGIARYNADKNSFENFLHDPHDQASIGYNDVLSIVEDTDNSIWVGTENGGISIYHPETNNFTTFANDIYDQKSLSSNSVYCLYKDDIGNIWVGTYSGGVNFMSVSGKKFKLYRNEINRNSLNNNIVLSIKGDSSGHIWIGTDGGGLNMFNPKTNQFSAYKNQQKNTNSPKSNYIISITSIGKNDLALGYHRNGFDLFNTSKKLFTHYTSGKNNQNSLPGFSVNALFTDRNKNIWIGTWMNGLFCYDPVSKRITQFKQEANRPASLCNNYVNSIYEDNDGILWVATENGLDAFDRRNNIFTHFTHNDNDRESIGSNTVQCLLAGPGNYLWVGTAGGLCLLNKLTKKFCIISESDGLANNVINSLIQDSKGNLWMSTNRGISKYNHSSKVIKNYDISDGLQGNEFKVGSVYQTPTGTVYFGGTDGFNIFHPDSIRENPFIPPVYLTDFQIFNKSVVVGSENSPLTEHISMSKLITLTHDQGVFSFEFAALNYTLPQKNQYAYKLEGFDKDWNYVGHKRTATYTNLDAGDYTFRVKGANNDGLWNEKGVTVTIRILPPYWKTWWFRTVAVLLLTGAAYLFYQGRISTIQAQKWALEQIVEERTERLHQEQVLNKMKSQFVSTASHEFRTPLTTIQSSIDLVDMYLDFPPDSSKPLIQKHLRVVEKEIGKFGDLLDDVLTIEKMNAGKVRFTPKEVDLPAICEDLITTHFQMRKDHRCVEMSVSGQPRLVLLDEKLIRHAVVNLLSNAFKFSATNPRLAIIFDEIGLSLAVSDDGIGIPTGDVSHLFETFFRAGNVSTIQGTGLGLFITKQSVELHGGTIDVQSRENEGTTFVIKLPV